MRLKTASLMIALGCAAIALSGCARVRTHQGYLVDNMLVDSIQPGIDNRQSVEGTLGRPTFVSQFGTQDWYYVSRDMRQLAFANPKPKEQTVLRVRFDTAGNVVGIDKAGLDKVAEISPKDGKTPTEIHYWFMQGDVKINAYVTLRPDGTYAKVRLYNNSTYKGDETVFNGNEGGTFKMPVELLLAYPFELPISRPSSPSYLYHP